jgi:hypothetical protein
VLKRIFVVFEGRKRAGKIVSKQEQAWIWSNGFTFSHKMVEGAAIVGGPGGSG